MTNRTNYRTLTSLTLAGILFLSSRAFGGYIYQFENTADPSQNATLIVDGEHLRITSEGNQGSDMIFDAGTSTMTILEHDRKRYLVLDKETIAELASQLEEAMAEMERQLASLPPAQRKAMEGMIKGQMQGLGEALPELSLERTSESDTISGIEVTKVLLLKDGTAASELWVADWDDVEGSEELMASLQAMAEMYSDMMKAFSQGPMAGMISANASSNWFGQIEEIGGMPIMSKELDASGYEISQTSLTKSEAYQSEPTTFAIPKGYKKQKLNK